LDGAERGIHVNAVIAGYVRTPFDFASKGRLAAVRPDDLAALALRGLVTRLEIDPAIIEDVVMGCSAVYMPAYQE
jgi:acetyl-CoA acyltransferase